MIRQHSQYVALLISFCLLFSTSAMADQVHVAVAANFIQPMRALAEQFSQNTGHKVTLSSASSGKLFAQITQGAPFDIFLSADQVKPERLIAKGLAPSISRFTYATGTLVLWSPNTSAKVHAQTEHPLQNKLRKLDFHRLALANPKFAPYGSAAMDVLQHMNLIEKTRGKLVRGENIAQTFQFAQSGNADLAFVALSQLKSLENPLGNNKSENHSGWIIPQMLHQPIHQDAVLLSRAKENQAAKALLLFLREAGSQKTIRSFGYTIDGKS